METSDLPGIVPGIIQETMEENPRDESIESLVDAVNEFFGSDSPPSPVVDDRPLPVPLSGIRTTPTDFHVIPSPEEEILEEITYLSRGLKKRQDFLSIFESELKERETNLSHNLNRVISSLTNMENVPTQCRSTQTRVFRPQRIPLKTPAKEPAVEETTIARDKDIGRDKDKEIENLRRRMKDLVKQRKDVVDACVVYKDQVGTLKKESESRKKTILLLKTSLKREKEKSSQIPALQMEIKRLKDDKLKMRRDQKDEAERYKVLMEKKETKHRLLVTDLVNQVHNNAPPPVQPPPSPRTTPVAKPKKMKSRSIQTEVETGHPVTPVVKEPFTVELQHLDAQMSVELAQEPVVGKGGISDLFFLMSAKSLANLGQDEAQRACRVVSHATIQLCGSIRLIWPTVKRSNKARVHLQCNDPFSSLLLLSAVFSTDGGWEGSISRSICSCFLCLASCLPKIPPFPPSQVQLEFENGQIVCAPDILTDQLQEKQYSLFVSRVLSIKGASNVDILLAQLVCHYSHLPTNLFYFVDLTKRLRKTILDNPEILVREPVIPVLAVLLRSSFYKSEGTVGPLASFVNVVSQKIKGVDPKLLLCLADACLWGILASNDVDDSNCRDNYIDLFVISLKSINEQLEEPLSRNETLEEKMKMIRAFPKGLPQYADLNLVELINPSD